MMFDEPEWSRGEQRANRHQRAKALFARVLSLPEAERATMLDSECSDNAPLKAEIESLLSHATESPTMVALEVPAGSKTDPLIGSTIGRYHIKTVIGSGGMGTVYQAMQEQPRRVVALKVMRRGITSRSTLRRFVYESQTLARLCHPGIAQIFEAGTHQGESGESVPYFAMEYIPAAMPITGYAEEKELGTRERLELFARVCDAVQHGHGQGVIHRDLKPSNILIDSTGQPKIIDFGVARSTDNDMAVTTPQTDIGQLIGTLQYMSPEQCLADPTDLDTRSDVYTLGVVLYELLCGQPPYDISRAAVFEATRIICESTGAKPSTISKALRGDIETVVLKAMEKDRDRRYRSAAAFGDDLRHFLNSEPISAHPPSLAYQVRIFAKKNKFVFRAGVVAILALMTGVIVASVGMIYGWAQYGRAEAALIAKEEGKERAELTIYGQVLLAAEAAISMGDGGIAQSLLDNMTSRGWEYLHLRQRADDSWAQFVHRSAVLQLSLSPVSDLLLTVETDGSGGLATVKSAVLWSTANPWVEQERKQPLSRFGTGVSAVAILSDGNSAALGHQDGTLSIWDISDPANPRERFRETVMTGTLGFVGADPSGPLLVVAGPRPTYAKLVRIERDGPKVIATLPGHEEPVQAASFASDGTRLATMAPYDPEVRVWALDNTGVARLVALLRGHNYHLQDVAISRDGSTVATASIDRTVKLWDLRLSEQEFAEHGALAKGVVIDTIGSHTAGVRACAFSPDGTLLATAADDMAIRLWGLRRNSGAVTPSALRLSQRQPLATLLGHSAWPRGLAFDAKGVFLYSASEDGTVRVWLMGPADGTPILAPHSSSVVAVGFTIRPGELLSLDGNGWLNIWDTASYRKRSCYKIPDVTDSGVKACTAHPRLAMCIIGSASGSLHGVDFSNAEMPRTVWQSTVSQSDGPCLKTTYDATGSLLAAAYESGLVRIWSVNSDGIPTELKAVFRFDGRPLAIAFSPDSQRLAIGGGASGTESTDDETASEPLVLLLDSERQAWTTLTPPASACQALCWSSDGRKLVGTDSSGKVLIWDVRSRSLVAERQAHSEVVRTIAMHPTERRFATAGRDRLIKIWDLDSTVIVASLRGHIGHVRDLAWSPDGRVLASASAGSQGADNAVHLWETGVSPEIRRIQNQMIQAKHITQTRMHEGINRADVLDEIARIVSDELALSIIEEEFSREAERLNGEAWSVVERAGEATELYMDALRDAIRADELAPDDWRKLNTLGVAQIRCGLSAQALDTLRRADAIYKAMSDGGDHPVIWAGIAIAEHNLGHNTEARAAFKRVRQLMSDPAWKTDKGASAFALQIEEDLGYRYGPAVRSN